MTGDFSTRVVSICHQSHKDVWRLTSELLPRFVKADEYFVYVPQNEMDDFRKISSPLITVRSQESLDVGFGKLLLEKVRENFNEARFGWYLQQLYKIEALIESPTSATIIWDADGVPTRSIEMFNQENEPLFMRATENHRAYFEMIDRLLGLPIVQNQSFIVPGFPMLNPWINDFVKYVENRHIGKTWFEAIVQDTNLRLQGGFSEFETLGTWIANSYPRKWHPIDLNWERYGQSRFNYARKLSPSDIVEIGFRHNLDLISFENWDLRGIRRKVKVFRIFVSRLVTLSTKPKYVLTFLKRS